MIGKRGRGKLNLIIGIVVLALLGVLLFFTFFYVKHVSSQEEFKQEFFNCNRASFVSDQDIAVWEYEILGKKKGLCSVEVELVSAKQGIADVDKLEGKSMICEIPLGVVASPEGNLKLCHGRLKEDIQDILIEKMHTYVTGNLDVIGNALAPVNSSG